ncbi:hypothetical protein CVT25_004291 [Psilocybe cyanescens]|uniref:Uncharacterized protein n=1 Tax=Psilocybe cyanescens TaxID=93625 RepID=A0A409WXN3_PSICY|nr:hypothetical protein CVT25_004291 [Psilocybe cyanescens]
MILHTDSRTNVQMNRVGRSLKHQRSSYTLKPVAQGGNLDGVLRTNTQREGKDYPSPPAHYWCWGKEPSRGFRSSSVIRNGGVFNERDKVSGVLAKMRNWDISAEAAIELVQPTHRQ